MRSKLHAYSVCMFLPDMLTVSVSPPSSIAKSEQKYTRHWCLSCTCSTLSVSPVRFDPCHSAEQPPNRADTERTPLNG